MRGYVLIGVLALAGCAKSPDAIVAADVGTTPYMQMSCSQLAAENARVSGQMQPAVAAQRQAQANDAAGVFLLGLPVGSMSGGSREGEISRLKGEESAIARVRTAKGC